MPKPVKKSPNARLKISPPEQRADDLVWKAYNDFHFFCDTARFQKLLARHQLFLRTAQLPGHIIDAGVFKGSSTILFAQLLKIYSGAARKKVIGFDTFQQAFSDVREFERSRASAFMEHHQPNMYEALQAILRAQDLTPYCELIKGDISRALPQYISKHRGMRVSLLHLDLDIFKPTLDVLKAVVPLMVPGGLIVLDQYGVEGWGESEAVDAYFSAQKLRPRLELVPNTSSPTAVISI
jgi:predicted O-methyltransferase YrrM